MYVLVLSCHLALCNVSYVIHFQRRCGAAMVFISKVFERSHWNVESNQDKIAFECLTVWIWLYLSCCAFFCLGIQNTSEAKEACWSQSKWTSLINNCFHRVISCTKRCLEKSPVTAVAAAKEIRSFILGEGTVRHFAFNIYFNARRNHQMCTSQRNQQVIGRSTFASTCY